MQIFTLDKGFIQSMRLSICAAILMALFLAALPFMFFDPGETIYNQSKPLLTVAIFGPIICLYLGWCCFRGTKDVSLISVAVDDDGLWKVHLGKEVGLVSWHDIASIRDRYFLQRLDLMNNEGTMLIKLEYQLEDFDQLRSIVANKITTTIQTELPTFPVTFAKSLIYYLESTAALVLLILSGWYFLSTLLWLGCLSIILALLLVHEFLTTVHKVIIDRDHLIIQYPSITRTYLYSQIESVQVRSTASSLRDFKAQEVDLLIKASKKPHILNNLGVEANTLHQTILTAWKSRSDSASSSI